MRVTVLKDFDYAHDGIASKRVKEGETVEVRDGLIPGLKDAGLIGPVGSKTKAPAPAAPQPTAEEIAAAAADSEAADKAKAEQEVADKAAAAKAAAEAALGSGAGGKGK
jgi:membrane protein involved in colicin uptake